MNFGDKMLEVVASLGGLIVTAAIIAILVGQHAETSGVISSSGSAFASDLTAAEGPVLGS